MRGPLCHWGSLLALPLWGLKWCSTCFTVVPPIQHCTPAPTAPDPGPLRASTAHTVAVAVGDRRATSGTEMKAEPAPSSIACSPSSTTAAAAVAMRVRGVPGDRCLNLHVSHSSHKASLVTI